MHHISITKNRKLQTHPFLQQFVPLVHQAGPAKYTDNNHDYT